MCADEDGLPPSGEAAAGQRGTPEHVRLLVGRVESAERYRYNEHCGDAEANPWL